MSKRKKPVEKLTKDEKAKIRYQIYRDLGYSPKEARKLRYQSFYAVNGVKFDESGNVIKKRNYKRVLKAIEIDKSMNDLREKGKDIDTVYNLHGYYASRKVKGNRGDRGLYGSIVAQIKQQNRLTNDQAWYFAKFMLQSGYTYEQAKTELKGNREFEMYDKYKRARRREIKRQNRMVRKSY